ncbi:hypothetical protein [Oceaniglobus ichthyenteri]|uniref:hypothetical protein n=1 Tax=Oceaniglobus ichthyenteri TaxID=2136177 RepID=UPI000D3C61EE|nr:hypothetical protein [Oceaniglobus ichthyenteri]
MTLQNERKAIETYFTTAWTDTTVPVGMDGHEFTPSINSIRLTIKSGAAIQGSIGRIANRIDHIGTLTATIYTAGGEGSAAWRGYAETITGLFFEKSITSAGALITTGTDTFIRFSPPQLGDNRHPYIAADFASPPFHQTNVIAPYVRYSHR